MVAATKKYIQAEDVIRQTNKRRGRPCAIPKENIYLLTAGAVAGKTWRQTTNNFYQAKGLGVAHEVIDDDEKENEIFIDGKKLRYAGVLEQFGRMVILYEKDKITAENLVDYVFIGLDMINGGEKSKDIEKELRKVRINFCKLNNIK